MRAVLPALALALALPLAVPAGAQGLEAQASAFVAVVQANGCAITEAEGAALLGPAGLTLDDAREAVAILNRGGLFTVDPDGETLRLVPELCAATPAEVAMLLVRAAAAPETGAEVLSLAERVDPAEAVRFLAQVRANGCALTEAEADAILPTAGFTMVAVRDIVRLLSDYGMLALADGRLALSPPACASDAAADAAWIAILRHYADGALPPPEGPVDPASLALALAMFAIGHDCALAPDQAAASVDWVQGTLNLTALSPAGLATLAGQVDAFLAAPDPAFVRDGDRLRLIHCPP